jgi:DNA-directed RNA polymerase specialized sigma24 family protein
MEAAVQNIPTRQRDNLLAHHVHGLSYGEITDRTGLSMI